MGSLMGRRYLQRFALVIDRLRRATVRDASRGCYRGGSQCRVAGHILTARPILRGMAKTILTPRTGAGAAVVRRRADQVMRIKRLPAGSIIPAQPVMASTPPSGADWVDEIKHDGYRMIVRRDVPSVRLYSRNAHDWTERLSAICGCCPADQSKELHDRWRGGCARARRLVAIRRAAPP
jgi:hypothetical protein